MLLSSPETAQPIVKRTGALKEVRNQVSASSGDDIITQYTLDDNGRATTITDPRGNGWVKAYDAMGRMTTLTTPNSGGGAFTHTNVLDGNSNITKTTDFRGTDHYYAYDGLNRMTGQGADSGADDETYSWGCCSRLLAYTDALGTADYAYDELNRLSLQEDSQGNTVLYEYDSMSRVTKIVPAQGTNYRIQYAFKKNGSVETAAAYEAGLAETTTYAYNTTSGKLTSRTMPLFSGKQVVTDCVCDDGGRRGGAPCPSQFGRRIGASLPKVKRKSRRDASAPDRSRRDASTPGERAAWQAALRK